MRRRDEWFSMIDCQISSQVAGIEFVIQRCGVLIMKRGKFVSFEGVDFLNGENIKNVEQKGYKYLRVLEYDKIKEKNMKESSRGDYLEDQSWL